MDMNFIKEIRIYYECLEQAYHYVYPSIRDVIGEEISIKLVKLKKKKNPYKVYAYPIADYLFWKYPDILISIVTTDDIEIPIVAVEFSTAVFTEDHELQRFDGMVTAAERGIVFVKISPIEKKSEFQHGGKKDFDYKIPFYLVYKSFGIMLVHINWKSKGSIVEVDENYLSCPKDRKPFTELLKIVFNSLTSHGINIEKYNNLLANHNYFSQWFYKVKNVIQQWSEKELISLLKRKLKSTSRINIDTKRKIITLKFNRFGHAMDPERGMLVFYSTAFRSFGYFIRSKMIFDESNNAWYKGIGKTNEIRNYIKSKGLQKSEDYLYILNIGLGITQSYEDIAKYIITKDNTQVKIDITDFVLKNWQSLSKPLRTIIKYSDEFVVEDIYGRARVILQWNKNKIRHIANQKFIGELLRVTPLKHFTEIDEDLVTYITIHNILRPQGYKILAASYPGAQGDRVILIEKSKGGRKQERRYVDVISYSKTRNITTLQSNKDKLSQHMNQLNKEIEELSKFKRDKNYIEGLKLFLIRFEKDALGSLIKIGIGFWDDKEYNASILKDFKLEDLDYFVVISRDMKRWKVFECRKGNSLLDVYEGDVAIPEIFEPKS